MSTAVIGTHAVLASPRLRLTARGRVVLFLVVAIPVVIAAIALVLGGGSAVATGEAGNDFSYVTVEGGQSLWQLATELAPSADPREVVSDITHLNQLSSSDVHPGQRLAIPAQYAN